VQKRKVYVDGVTVNTAKGRETVVALEASNLLLVSLTPTEERKKFFSAEAFKKPKAEKPKKEEKPEAKKAKVEVKAEKVKPEAAKPKVEAAKPAPAAPAKPETVSK